MSDTHAYDAIVIGSGHNGHTNAAYQASLGIPKAEVKADPATAPLYDGKTSPIWYRGYFDGRLDTEGVQAVLDRLGLKRIVVGHTSMPTVLSLHGGRVIGVDSSLKKGRAGELLRAIEAPVRVVAADPAPPYFPPEVRQARLGCLREASVVVLPGSHHLHMEQPEAVAAPVLDFLRG